MNYFEYKVVPAPRRSKKTRGVSDPADLFSLTLTESINEHARAGWEYLRSESLETEIPGGWFSRSRKETVAVLVFRRHRETLGPRIETREAPQDNQYDGPPAAAEPRPFGDRLREVTSSRREPVLGNPPRPAPGGPSPLRPSPRIDSPDPE